MKQFGIQLYSVREEIKNYGLETVLDVIKASGFDCVEFAGFYGRTPEEIKKLLDDRGLKGVSAHIMLNDIEKNLEYIDTVGIERVYVPWESYEDLRDKLPEIAAKIKEVKVLLDKRGVVFGYHNHSQEYRDGADRVYELMEAVPGFTSELDIFWATAGGHDPVELMRKYGKRLTALHIKEMDKRTNIANPTEYHEAIVGEGMSNTAAVMEYAKELGIELFVLEVESYPCDYEEYLEKSCANMKKLAGK